MSPNRCREFLWSSGEAHLGDFRQASLGQNECYTEQAGDWTVNNLVPVGLQVVDRKQEDWSGINSTDNEERNAESLS